MKDERRAENRKKNTKESAARQTGDSAVRVREQAPEKGGTPFLCAKEQKKISPIVGARSARGAARGFGPRDRPRSTAETSAVARHATRRGSRAWGSAATGRARRRFGRARCAELCTLSRRRVVPVRGDSALARERVAGGDAARRLGERRDPASQNRPRRHRDGWEGSNRDRSAAGNESRPFQGVQQKYLAFSRVSFRLKSAPGVRESRSDVGSRFRAETLQRRRARSARKTRSDESDGAAGGSCRKTNCLVTAPAVASRARASTGHHGDERRDTLAR